MNHQPVYIQIKNEILRRIQSGEWRSGEAIPPELRLAQMFGVSRMTVNRALSELSEARVLERRQGSGTYVAQKQYNHIRADISNVTEEIRARGGAYRAQVLCQEQVRADHDLAEQLSIPVGLSLAHVIVLHDENQMPIQYEERWVNLAVAPAFLEQDFTRINTSAYLIENIPLGGGEYCVQALPAPEKVAHALQIAENAPSLVLTRRTVSQQQFANYVVMWHPGARYQIRGDI